MYNIKLGLFFIALTTLLLELTLIRVFDHLWFPNMAYLIITLAMFSIGVSGVIISLAPAEQYRYFKIIIPLLTVLMATACYAILPALNELQFNYKALGATPFKALLTFLSILVVIATPFLISGLVISSIFSRYADQIQKLYFWDLAGAAMGCVIIILVVKRFSGPGLVVLCTGTSLVAAAFFMTNRIISIVTLCIAAAIAVTPLLLNHQAFDITPHMNKRGFKLFHEDKKIENSIWDPVSSIDVIDFRSGIKWVAYDGGTMTSYYYKFDGDYESLRENIEEQQSKQFWGPMVLASHMLKADTDQEVLVIGAAGGQETKAALVYGASHVDAVELVESVVNYAKANYAEWTGNVYNHPKVNAVHGEGRSFLRSTDKKYDIIQIMSNHTSSSLAAGSGAMSPVYLQTVEAYKEYFNHLKDDGILHINHHLYPRMIATASQAWYEMGRTNFREHTFVMEAAQVADNLPTTLIKMTPWTQEEITALEELLNFNGGFHTVVHPLIEDKNYLPEEFFNGQLSAETIEQTPYHIGPVTDDNPFFNFIRRSLAVEEVDNSKFVNHSAAFLLNKRREAGFPLDVLHLFVTGTASFIFALIVLGIPLLFSRTGRTKWEGKSSFMGYFACLGAGFIVIELVLIQMFMKLIGYPAYTYATVVFAMLLGAGLGSAASEKLDIRSLKQLRLPFMAAVVSVLVLLLFKDAIFNVALQAPLQVRIIVSSILLIPIGFFLGMPFPIGITLAKDKPAGTVAWCWAMNGLCTIVGGFFSVILSIYFGFTVTLLAAVSLYIVALPLLARMFHSAQQSTISTEAVAPA